VRSHQWIDQRSLALHEGVAATLEAHPQFMDVARRNGERWLQQNPATALREWRRILDSTPLAEVVALLRSSSDEAPRLRQSSPFDGLLTTEERRTIMGAYESRTLAAFLRRGPRPPQPPWRTGDGGSLTQQSAVPRLSA